MDSRFAKPASRAARSRDFESRHVRFSPSGPHRKYKRKPRPLAPLLPQIPLRHVHLRRTPDRPITDQQDGIRGRRQNVGVERQRAECRRQTETLLEENAYQSRAGARPRVQRHALHLLDRHATEQLDAQDRSPAGNARVRHDTVIGALQRLNGGNQADIQLARGQAIRQAAGHVEEIRPLPAPIRRADRPAAWCSSKKPHRPAIVSLDPSVYSSAC